MRRYLIAAVAVMMLGALVSVGSGARGGFPGPGGPPGGDDAPADTQVCHLRGNAGYFSLWLTEDGAADHIADDHGDGLAGDPVPDMAGFVFGEDCVPEEANNPPIAYDQTRVCQGLISIQLSAIDPDGDNLVNWAVVGVIPPLGRLIRRRGSSPLTVLL